MTSFSREKQLKTKYIYYKDHLEKISSTKHKTSFLVIDYNLVRMALNEVDLSLDPYGVQDIWVSYSVRGGSFGSFARYWNLAQPKVHISWILQIWVSMLLWIGF